MEKLLGAISYSQNFMFYLILMWSDTMFLGTWAAYRPIVPATDDRGDNGSLIE
jgi:hypothetical protein